MTENGTLRLFVLAVFVGPDLSTGYKPNHLPDLPTREGDCSVGLARLRLVPRWIASPFGCLFGFLCLKSAPVRGWVIEGGSLAGKDSSSASSRLASSSAFCALVLAFLFMGPSPVRHSAINRELRSMGRIIPPFLSCENTHLTISKSALWTRLRSACALLLSGQAPDCSASRGC
jgi:hypothetical protein